MVQLAARVDGEGVTVVAAGAAATFTCTGIETLTPVPVNLMVPVYAPAAVNDAVLKVTEKLAAIAWVTLKLLAESPIHDWLAVTVSASADVEPVLT